MTQNAAGTMLDVNVAPVLGHLLGIVARIEATRGVDVALTGMPEQIGDRVRDRLLQSNDDIDYGTTEGELADAIAELAETEKGYPAVAPLVEILRRRYLA